MVWKMQQWSVGKTRVGLEKVSLHSTGMCLFKSGGSNLKMHKLSTAWQTQTLQVPLKYYSELEGDVQFQRVVKGQLYK